MNLGEIARNVGMRTGRGASDGAVLSFVNEALALYSNAGNWPWLRNKESTTVTAADGIDEWQLPYLTRTVSTIRANGGLLRQVPDFDDGRFGWWSDGRSVHFLPGVASGTQLEVETYRMEPPLSDVSSSPLISDIHIWPIIALASALVLERSGGKQQMEQGRVQRTQYEDWVRSQQGQQMRTSTVRIKMRGDHPAARRMTGGTLT